MLLKDNDQKLEQNTKDLDFLMFKLRNGKVHILVFTFSLKGVKNITIEIYEYLGLFLLYDFHKIKDFDIKVKSSV